MRCQRSVFAAVLMTAAAAGWAAEPRQPTARWVVHFDDAQCVASRNYGTVASPLFLVLKSPPLGDVIQVGVVRPERASGAVQVDGQMTFDNRAPLPVSMLAYTVNEQNHRGYLANLPVQHFAPARTATVIAIRAKGRLDESFAISGLQPLMKVMDRCVADLRRVWNIDQENRAASPLKEWPQAEIRGLFRGGDYPAQAMYKNQSGTARLVLLVDERGRVADCTVIETSGAASLDGQSCAILTKRARFKPAIGLDGKPAKGSFIQRIGWETRP